MKKLIATLFVATLSFSLVAVAGPTYTLKNGTYENAFAVLEPTQFTPSTNTTYYTASNLSLDYTVTGSVNRTLAELQKVKVKDENGNYVKDAKGNFVYEKDADGNFVYEKDADGNFVTNNKYNTPFDLAHVYFTSHNNFRMALFVDIDPNQTKDELFIDTKLNITDYGIYLFENNDPTSNNLQYISLYNNDVEIKEGQNFGVYYTADTTYGNRVVGYPTQFDMSQKEEVNKEDTVDVTYTTKDNWIGSFDGPKKNNHQMNADAAWYSDTKMNSKEAIFCMFQGPYEYREAAYLEWEHVEFGFVTTGQPLPGTLATILISGLCAGALRKRSKKH